MRETRWLAELGGCLLLGLVWLALAILAFLWLRRPVREWPDAAAALIALGVAYVFARVGQQYQPWEWLRHRVAALKDGA